MVEKFVDPAALDPKVKFLDPAALDPMVKFPAVVAEFEDGNPPQSLVECRRRLAAKFVLVVDEHCCYFA